MAPVLFNSYKNGCTYSYWLSYEEVFLKPLGFTIYRLFIKDEVEEEGAGHPSFYVVLKIMSGDKELKLIDLFPADHYRGKGLSVAIITEARKLFQRTIISSSTNCPTYTGESRRIDATNKVWQRLVDDGLAGYDGERDVFYTL